MIKVLFLVHHLKNKGDEFAVSSLCMPNCVEKSSIREKEFYELVFNDYKQMHSKKKEEASFLFATKRPSIITCDPSEEWMVIPQVSLQRHKETIINTENGLWNNR
jgi:hypothetical protein